MCDISWHWCCFSFTSIFITFLHIYYSPW